MDEAQGHLCACRTCGLIQYLPETHEGVQAHCARCDLRLADPPATTWALPAAVAALLLYPLAMSLPVMSIERFGITTTTDIWHGTLALLQRGHWLVGIIVLICSVIIPVCKLLALVGLSVVPQRWRDRHRALAWRLVEAAGRWGMIDVMLVAGVVAAVKIGDLVKVTPGPGAAVFATMVLLSLLAAATFDPHRMWTDASTGEPHP